MKGDLLEDFFYHKLTDERKYFMSICNLKLNNGLLVGNGKNFVRSIKTKIREAVADFNTSKSADVQFVILHCFSWFELPY